MHCSGAAIQRKKLGTQTSRPHVDEVTKGQKKRLPFFEQPFSDITLFLKTKYT